MMWRNKPLMIRSSSMNCTQHFTMLGGNEVIPQFFFQNWPAAPPLWRLENGFLLLFGKLFFSERHGEFLETRVLCVRLDSWTPNNIIILFASADAPSSSAMLLKKTNDNSRVVAVVIDAGRWQQYNPCFSLSMMDLKIVHMHYMMHNDAACLIISCLLASIAIIIIIRCWRVMWRCWFVHITFITRLTHSPKCK